MCPRLHAGAPGVTPVSVQVRGLRGPAHGFRYHKVVSIENTSDPVLGAATLGHMKPLGGATVPALGPTPTSANASAGISMVSVFGNSGTARLKPSSGQLSRAWMARSWACNMSRCDASAGSARRKLAAWIAAPTSPRRS